MSSTTPAPTEQLVQLSRRQLWLALGFLLMIGVMHLGNLLMQSDLLARVGIPFMLCLMVGSVASLKKKGVDISAANPAMKAILNDELRQCAQARAFRNGFFMLLAYLPLCAFVVSGLALNSPLAVMAGSSVWVGAVTVLASLLWYDR